MKQKHEFHIGTSKLNIDHIYKPYHIAFWNTVVIKCPRERAELMLELIHCILFSAFLICKIV